MTPQPTSRHAARLLGADWRPTDIGAAQILKRARAAAGAILNGGHFTSEERADAAAAVLMAVIADIGGAPPTDGPRAAARRSISWRLSDDGASVEGWTAPARRDDNLSIRPTDRRASFARCKSVAEHVRRDILLARQRAAELRSAEAMIAPPVDDRPPAGTLCQRAADAARLADALDVEPSPPVMAALLAAADQRAERERPPMTAAERQRVSRGAAELRRTLTATDAAQRVAGRVLVYAPADAERRVILMAQPGAIPAAGRDASGRLCPAPRHPLDTGRMKRADDWRTGTDGGHAPARPSDDAAADALSTTRRQRARKTRDIIETDRTGAQRVKRERIAARTDEDDAAARQRLGRALARAERPTDQRERRRSTGAEPTPGL